MKKFSLLITLISSCTFSTQLLSQVSEEWTEIYSYSGFGDESSESLFGFKTDEAGNSYAFGSTRDSSEMSFLVKYDKSGNLKWTFFIDSSMGRRISPDEYGNIICASWQLKSSSWDTTIITKVDSNGNMIWQSTCSGHDPSDIGIDYSGNIIVLSELSESPGDPRTLTKLSEGGLFLWSTNFNLDYGEEFGPYFRIGSDNSISVITEKFEVLKFDSNGTLQWDQDLDALLQSSSGYKASNAISEEGDIFLTGSTEIYNFQNHPHLIVCMIDSSGAVNWIDTLAGSFYEGLTVIPFPNGVGVVGIDSSWTGLHYLKFDLHGNLIFDSPISENDFKLRPTDYAMDEDGNIYLVGYAKDSLLYDGFAAMKIDSMGNFLWNEYKAGSCEGNSYEHPLISLDQNDNVYAANTGNPDMATFSVHDVAIVKYIERHDGISSIDQSHGIKISPNPGSNEVTIELGNLSIKNVVIQIFDQLGNVIQREEIQNNNSRITLPTENFVSGLYLITIISESMVTSAKWLKL